MKKKIKFALKIDIDTYHGAKYGVPNLLRLLKEFNIKATFFATLGPDKSGRAIIRIFTRGFLKRMAKLGPVKTYGFRTMFYGTLIPAPVIANKCSQILLDIKKQGHEVGLHAYDHAKWQDSLHKMSLEQIENELGLGIKLYQQLFGQLPKCFAAPGWQCNENSLIAEDHCNFTYASDARGKYPFFTKVNSSKIRTLQIPTTLPTFDELFMRDISEGEIIPKMISFLTPEGYNILNIHPEFEGTARIGILKNFLEELTKKNIEFFTLSNIAENILNNKKENYCTLVSHGKYSGRSGYVALQGAVLN